MPPGDSSTTLSFSQLVFSDYARYRPGAKGSWLGVVLRMPSTPGLVASVILRLQQVLARSGRTRLAEMLRTLGNSVIGADFGAGMVIGTGFGLVHPVGVTMGYGARIGDNVTFAGGVVLAARNYDPGAPGVDEFAIIEDNVVIGAHAVLVGGVRIGRNAMVGANSVVLSDVSENTVVMGVPAKRVGMREATSIEQ